MKTETPVVPWIRATCFGLGLVLAAGGAYLFLCGAGLIAGETHSPGILDLLLGIVVIRCGSSMFRARRLLAVPITTWPSRPPS